jgi:hypothetical protein
MSPIPPAPTNVAAFGRGFALGYAAATRTYALSGDSLALTYGPADLDATAPAGTVRYARTVNGFG